MTRWNRRLLLGAVVMLVPVLAGCEAGLNAPTLQYHPANFTANKTKNGISFSNVFVLGPALHGPAVAGGRTGVFLSLYAQHDDRLESVRAEGTASQVSILGGAVNLPANSLVDLGGPVPRVVMSGLADPLEGGETVPMDFTFARAGTITLDVPVEAQSFEFGTYSPPPTPSASPSATGKKGRAKGSASASASASPSASPSATP